VEHTITPDTFQVEVLESELPVLVDVFSPSCRPCSAMVPTIKRLSEERDGQLKVVKLNSDGNGDFVRSLGVSALPTFLVYRAGKKLATVTGVLPRERLTNFVDEALREPPKRSTRPPK
jgi:thioredoxin 1